MWQNTANKPTNAGFIKGSVHHANSEEGERKRTKTTAHVVGAHARVCMCVCSTEGGELTKTESGSE